MCFDFSVAAAVPSWCLKKHIFVSKDWFLAVFHIKYEITKLFSPEKREPFNKSNSGYPWSYNRLFWLAMHSDSVVATLSSAVELTINNMLYEMCEYNPKISALKALFAEKGWNTYRSYYSSSLDWGLRNGRKRAVATEKLVQQKDVTGNKSYLKRFLQRLSYFYV